MDYEYGKVSSAYNDYSDYNSTNVMIIEQRIDSLVEKIDLLEEKIDSLEENTNNIEETLNIILSKLNNNVIPNAENMTRHISFVENIFQYVKNPLCFICNKINKFIEYRKYEFAIGNVSH